MKAASIVQVLVVLIIALVGLVILFVTPNLLPSVLLAMVAYYFLQPLILRLNKKGLSWNRSAQIIYFSIGVFFTLLSAVFIPILIREFRELGQMLPELMRTATLSIQSYLGSFELWFGYNLSPEVIREIKAPLLEWGANLLQNLPNWMSQSFVLFFLSPLFTYFFMVESHQWPKMIIQKLPLPFWPFIERWQKDLNQQIGGFIRARFFESLLVLVLTWIGLQIIGLPFAFLLACLAAVLNVLPYIGPVLAAIPALVIALATSDPSQYLVGTLVVYILVQTLDAFVIVPFFIARIVQLHSLVVIIAILLGGYLMGVIGMIISIPIAGMLKVTLSHLFSWLRIWALQAQESSKD